MGKVLQKAPIPPAKKIIIKHLDDVERYLAEKYPDLLPDFAVLQARYCLSILFLLLDNQATLKTYREDYREFYSRFKQSYRYWLKSGKTTPSERLKGCLIYYRLYYVIHALKKGRI